MVTHPEVTAPFHDLAPRMLCGPALLIHTPEPLAPCHSVPEKLPLRMVPGHSGRWNISDDVDQMCGPWGRKSRTPSPFLPAGPTGRCPEPLGGSLQSSSPSARAATTETKSTVFVLHHLMVVWAVDWPGEPGGPIAAQQDRTGRGPSQATTGLRLPVQPCRAGLTQGSSLEKGALLLRNEISGTAQAACRLCWNVPLGRAGGLIRSWLKAD